ncbi:MAG: hypothetical protein PHC88_13265 [Terrimicrobiaceae bacterium]|nr:hypothetical protein [Terrimicrobiaceae bacterium]
MTKRRRATGWWMALALLAITGCARAEDSIWAALVLGTNEHPPKPPPKELAHYAAGLQTVFGYNTFYLLGDRSKKIRKGSEAWIVPTKQVFLKVRCLDRSVSSYTVHLELYVKKQLVVTSEVKFARNVPLYIRGPAWGRGRLVFILEVR